MGIIIPRSLVQFQLSVLVLLEELIYEGEEPSKTRANRLSGDRHTLTTLYGLVVMSALPVTKVIPGVRRKRRNFRTPLLNVGGVIRFTTEGAIARRLVGEQHDNNR